MKEFLTWKRMSTWMTAIGVLLCLSGAPLLAQHGRAGGGAGGGMGMGQGRAGDTGMGNASGTRGDQGMGREQGGINGPQKGTSGTRMSKSSPTTLLSQNTRLASNLQKLLPAGTNLQDAASGFKNLGQFVAAVHVSHNLGIPFDQLKSTMLSNGDNLGKAIATLNPNISKKEARSDTKKANKEANQDIREANS